MAELASQPTSIQSIYTWYREGKLFVNRRYQRKLVWTQVEKQKLIESILKKYPIPAILIAERDAVPGTYEIIDGLQRLHSIVSFIENQFSLESGEFFNVDHFPTAKVAAKEGAFTAKESGPLLSAKDVSILLDYSLALSVMRNATNAEVNDVFDRINTYGHRLSDQERRQAGVQNEFSSAVRTLACTLRGDDSASEILPLQAMPAISIDLPSANHGYEVKADEVFWVKHGILRSTDLRDSLDEQCLADIIACIVGGKIIERSKESLDLIYTKGSSESETILSALEVYGSTKVCDEIKYCVSEILKICTVDGDTKLRNLIFKKGTTNAFPSVFSVILVAIHELIISGKKANDYLGIKRALTGLSDRISTTKKGTTEDERRKNIDTVKGLVSSCFVEKTDIGKEIYGDHSVVDIESIIRRSEIELPNYELKQGILVVKKDGEEDQKIFQKLINTICAIANNGPNSKGKLLLGVTDKPEDAKRIGEIDKIVPRPIGKRYVVGINREAVRLGISVEQYFTRVKTEINNSQLSDELKNGVLSSIDYNSFYGLGLIIISVPPQTSPSYVGEEMYWRNGDSTELASSAKQIAHIAKRF